MFWYMLLNFFLLNKVTRTDVLGPTCVQRVMILSMAAHSSLLTRTFFMRTNSLVYPGKVFFCRNHLILVMSKASISYPQTYFMRTNSLVYPGKVFFTGTI